MIESRETKPAFHESVAHHSDGLLSGNDVTPRVLLVGGGAVGRAIAEAHLRAGIGFVIADVSVAAIDDAERSWMGSADFDVCFEASDVQLPGLHTRNVAITAFDTEQDASDAPWLVIESIPENLELKQSFFASLQKSLGTRAILCSNTSTLRIANVAESLDDPSRLIGMHFFMPVDQRPAVEVIASSDTDEQVIRMTCQHAQQIRKVPLLVADTPGFVVNRMLGPYLNESLLLLCEGVSPNRIADAATSYGMPMSPLALIDTIGMRTVFNAGSVYCKAFPRRLDPSPMLGRMIKKNRLGRGNGRGILDWESDPHSLHPETAEIASQYRRIHLPNDFDISDQELADRLSTAMAIEAATMMADGTVKETSVFDIAMQGGLGYQHPAGWLGYFRQLSGDRVARAIDRFGPLSSALRLPANIRLSDLSFRS